MEDDWPWLFSLLQGPSTSAVAFTLSRVLVASPTSFVVIRAHLIFTLQILVVTPQCCCQHVAHHALPFFLDAVLKVVGLMKGIFPELVDAEARVSAVIKDEEMSFNKTLDKGLKEFNKVACALGDNK